MFRRERAAARKSGAGPVSRGFCNAETVCPGETAGMEHAWLRRPQAPLHAEEKTIFSGPPSLRLFRIGGEKMPENGAYCPASNRTWAEASSILNNNSSKSTGFIKYPKAPDSIAVTAVCISA